MPAGLGYRAAGGLKAAPAAVLWTAAGGAALLVWGAVLAGMLLPGPPDGPALQYFDRSLIQRAAEYQRAGLGLYLARQALSVALLAAAVWLAWRHFGPDNTPSTAAAAGYIIVLLLLMQLAALPLAYVRGFVLEHRFGLSNDSAAGWLLNYAKSALVGTAVTALILVALYFLILHLPGRWWIPAGLAAALLLVVGATLHPLLIDPLFYRFTPLENGEFKDAIVEMAAGAGIELDGVLVADASRRTNRVNAYFTGLGRTKRIVLYDTLLQRFSRQEVLIVIAHEIGHWRHRHIPTGIAAGSAGIFAALGLFSLLMGWMGAAADFRAIPAALLFMALVAAGSAPLENYISRQFERQADREALALTGDTETFIALQQQMAGVNLSTVNPHPLIKFALYTHPPALERINRALAE